MWQTNGESRDKQMYVRGRNKAAYGAERDWEEARDAPAASQMRHIKRLMLARRYFERVPDQSLILDNGVRYDRVLATRGRDYAMAYSYTGRPFRVRLGDRKSTRLNSSH